MLAQYDANCTAQRGFFCSTIMSVDIPQQLQGSNQAAEIGTSPTPPT